MSYVPSNVPTDVKELPQFLREELEKIATKNEMVEMEIAAMRVLHSAPPKPRDGWLCVADGSDWNPGSGKGLYRYDGTSWNYCG